MITTWMLSAVVFTALLALAAHFAESALRTARKPTRWPWIIALAGSVVWPVLAPFARRLIASGSAVESVVATLPTLSIVPDDLPTTISWAYRLDAAVVTLWLVASAIVLARLVRGLVLLARIRRTSERRVVDGVDVLVSESVGPAVLGVLNPSVLLSASVLDLDVPLRRLVLRHEEEHRRAHDPWIVVGSALLLALVPWNLPLWWIAKRARLALEVDCDARVLAGEPTATQYGKLLMLISQRQAVTALAPMLAAISSHLERRIAAMLPTRSKHSAARIVLALAATVVAGIAACTSRIGDGITSPKPTIAERSPSVAADQPYFEFQVSRQATQIPGTGSIRYPDALRAANVQGEVLAQFVVNANGEIEPGSFKALKSDHDLFAQAVSNALPALRFRPAEVKGKLVRQLVQQPFTFSLGTSGAPSRAGRAAGERVEFVRGIVPPTTAEPRAAATLPVNADQPYFEFQVTKAAQQIPGSGRLRYPDALRQANVQGEVLAQFIVDANGEFEAGSFKVLKSSHVDFSEAVRLALPLMRFTPAEHNGAKVKQLIQQPFTFSLSKN